MPFSIFLRPFKRIPCVSKHGFKLPRHIFFPSMPSSSGTAGDPVLQGPGSFARKNAFAEQLASFSRETCFNVSFSSRTPDQNQFFFILLLEYISSRRLWLLGHPRTGLHFVIAVFSLHFDCTPSSLVVDLRARGSRSCATAGALLAVLRYHRRRGHVCLCGRRCTHPACLTRNKATLEVRAAMNSIWLHGKVHVRDRW